MIIPDKLVSAVIAVEFQLYPGGGPFSAGTVSVSGSDSDSSHPQFSVIESVAESSELVAVAIRVKVSLVL